MNVKAIDRLIDLETSGENRNPVSRPSGYARPVYGGDGVIVTTFDGAEYTRRGSQLVRINKNILTKKQRNKDKKLRQAAGL